MPTIEYLFLFPTGDVQLRHRHAREHGRVTSFTVQLELSWRGAWQPIVRYDTAHGFAHRDLLQPDGSAVKTPLGLGDWNVALTVAVDDLKANWRWYREQFLKEARDSDE